jgi:OST-HTH/LOTUS domain
MTDEQLKTTHADVRALVKLRNNLVHHFIEQFDLGTENGCAAAKTHLADAYARIDAAFGHLRGWASTSDQARASIVAFIQSQAFEDIPCDDVTPDGEVQWGSAGIVEALGAAGRALAVDGWTRLGDAIEWLRQHHPDQSPRRYGCSTWRQVLHESRQFQVRFELDASGSRVAWYQRLSA